MRGSLPDMKLDPLQSPPPHAGVRARKSQAPLALRRLAGPVIAVLLLLGCISINVAPTATITGSGRTVTRQFDLAGFSSVAAGHSFQVTITRGNEYRVTVTADDNLVDYLDVTTSGNALRLYLKPNLNLRNATLQAQITMPELDGVDLSGACHATIAGFSSEKALAIELSGASSLRGDIQSGDARMNLSGASNVELQGGAANLRVSASGASYAKLERFNVKTAVAGASGASRIEVNASDRLEADASGASRVRYVGKPEIVKRQASGASSIGEL